MIVAAVDAQTVVDAVGLGAVYALMAVGIGLVFGVLRLVNFAYGQLIMVGAYTLAYTSDWPVAASVLACFATVIVLSAVSPSWSRSRSRWRPRSSARSGGSRRR
jgi:branched-subunit amino acid ABC-type transport system permease component